MRQRQSRSPFPWLLVGAGALLYWGVALGLGVHALVRLSDPPRSPVFVEGRCVESVEIDGTPVSFGDCINVRFVPDPEAVVPAAVDREGRLNDMLVPQPWEREMQRGREQRIRIEKMRRVPLHDSLDDGPGRTAF